MDRADHIEVLCRGRPTVVGDEADCADEDSRGDGQVDEEDLAPAGAFGEQAACEDADDRGERDRRGRDVRSSCVRRPPSQGVRGVVG
jgi:hypothetical protein